MIEHQEAETLALEVNPNPKPNMKGVKGQSITHCLLNFLHFIQSSLDKSKPTAVAAAFIDMSKAFNRVDHNIFVQDLFDMHCPPWLLRILMSFLKNRSLILHYKGSKSQKKDLLGGSPQGTLLGVFVFIIKFNGALMRPPVQRPLSLKSEACKAKYMDDSSLAVSIPLDPKIVDTFLPKDENLLQMYIEDLENFTKSNGMKINHKKSKVMKFSRSLKCDFPLEIEFNDNNQCLEKIETIKLLGLMISENLKWNENTNYICKKARSKIFLLRNMKASGLSVNELIDAYTKEVRSLLELAVPVWSSGITLEQDLKIERVQKAALAVIFGQKYLSYDNALEKSKLKRLSVRRKQICVKFVTKNLKSDKPLWTQVNKKYNTRSNQSAINEFQCRTKAFFDSGLPFLARLYNQQLKEKTKYGTP